VLWQTLEARAAPAEADAVYSALPPKPTRAGRWVGDGAHRDRAVHSPNVMGLASLGQGCV
jgi:hypothetical protein